MKKLIKWVGILLGILVLLAILLTISLATFISPNRFKPLLAEKVKAYTGCELIIDGDLSWTFFPSIGVKTGHVALKNPPGFEQGIFAEVKDATVAVKLLPLLHKQIESSGIKLDGLKLHLVKDKQGQVNWGFPTNKSNEVTAYDQNNGDRAKPTLTAIAIMGLHITNSEITWTDEQKKQFVSLEKFNLHAKNINLLEPFPVSSEFTILNRTTGAKTEVRLKTNASLNMAAQVFSFRNLELNARMQQNKSTMNFVISSDLMLDVAKQNIQLENLKATSGDLVLSGKVNISNLMTAPMTAGHLQISPFDLKKWLKDSGYDMSAIQTLKNASADIDFVPVPKVIVIKGKLVITDVITDNVRMTNVVVPINYQNGVLSLSPVSAAFYQGNAGSDMTIDLNAATPRLTMRLTLNHFNMAALMKDLSPKQKLTLAGDGNVDMQLTSAGTDKTNILKNLNGTGHFNFNNGFLQGIDINYLIANATAMATKQASSSANTDKTEFSDLKGSFIIKMGVVANDDLLMNSTEFAAKGQGNIDLVNQTINYHLQTTLNQSNLGGKKQLLNLYGLPIPVLISGSLSSPAISLDRDALAKLMADQQVQKVKSQLQEKIEKGKIPEKAGKFLQHILGH